MKKVFTISLAIILTVALYASNNVISYTASSKLVETTDGNYPGLHINAFNVAVISHEFSDGQGVVTFAGDVTKVGDMAFRDCDDVTGITLPNSITSFGYCPFLGCSSLPVEGNIRYADTYLVDVTNQQLSSYTIKSGTKWIGNGAFSGCRNFNTISIPSTVLGIDEDAFKGCQSMVSINIPEGVNYIGNEAFNACSNLSSITLPNSLTKFGSNIFINCSSLPVINNIRYAGTYLIEAVDKTLTSYTIQNDTRWIGPRAFESCSNIETVTIPANVAVILGNAFKGCSNIKTINWNAKNCSLGQYSDSNPFYDYRENIESFVFGNAVEKIPNNLCLRMNKLTNITIPASVKEIGSYAFTNCSSLLSINVASANTHYCSIDGVLFNYAKDTLIQYPTGKTDNTYSISSTVKAIGDEAFLHNPYITAVTIPNTVSYIGYYAFAYCSNLADIYCYAPIPPVNEYSIDNIFEEISSHCYIHIPVGTVRAYQMAQSWRRFLHFYEISTLPDGTTTEQVSVTVTNNYATFTWPVNPTASSYTLEIKKNGEVFCSLIFNSLGQLVGMQFAPSRGESNVSSAEKTAYGYSFIINGLDENSTYEYIFAAWDDAGVMFETKSGSFTTGVNALNDLTDSPSNRFTKIIKNGQLYILRNGKTYNAQGGEL